MSKMRGVLAGLAVLGMVIPGVAFGGGCSSSSPSGSSDSGATDAGKDATDSGRREASGLIPFDAGKTGIGDASPGTGTLLQSGYGYILYGVTSDGYVVYSTSGEVPSFYVVPLAGGTPTSLGLAPGLAYAIVSGEVVFWFNNIDPTSYQSPLVIWSAKGGMKTLSTSSFLLTAATSSDNKYLLYVDNFDPNNQIGDIYVAAPDGSGATKLAGSVPGLAPQGTCDPFFDFAQTTAVVSFCPTPSTPTAATVNTYTAGSWTQTNNVTTATSVAFRTEPTGTYVMVPTSAGLEVLPLAGGAPRLIDATGTGGAFTSNAKNVVYTTSAKTLDISPIPSADGGLLPDGGPLVPTVLVGSGVTGLYELSKDDSTALVYNSLSQLSDLYTASATTPGSLSTIVGTAAATIPGGGFIPGNAFTADSSHVLFYTSLMQSATGQVFGDLSSVAVGSSSPTSLAMVSTTCFAASGSKVVFSANGSFGATNTLDILSVDTASAAAPKTIVTGATSGASAGFFLTPAKDKIVYSWTAPGTELGGLYVAPVP